MRATACTALLIAALAPQAASAGGLATSTRSTEPLPTDRLIIKYRDGSSATTRSAEEHAARAGHRMALLRVGVGDTRVMRVERRLPHAEMEQLARDIAAADPAILYAEPDRILRALATPNDTQYGQQWHYFEATAGLNLPPAWDKSTGSGVVVAVIDTGYRPHADLAANILPGYDFIADSFVSNDGGGRDSDAKDPGDAIAAGECGNGDPAQDESSSWHGTHVAGTIAAVSNNGSGVAGVAYGAKVLPVRVLGKCGGYTSDIAAGIVWASGGSVSGIPANPNPARVINLSLGGSGACDTTSRDAIAGARSRGTVVVVAAGNENVNASNSSPANCAGVIAVAAVNRSGGRAYYSNYGAVVAVAAPGGDTRSSAANGILSTLNAGSTTPGADSFGYYQGTSMAAPHVAGVVALMLAKNPALTPDEVATRLKSSARAFPATCSQCGTGIVDANAAVDAAGGTTPPPTGGNEVEPNNSTGTAQSVAIGATINGTMSGSSDSDYFRITLAAGAALSATLTPNGSSDYDLYLYNGSGSLIGSSEAGTGSVDSVSTTNTATASRVYYVRVRYYSGATGTAGTYSLGLR